MGYSRLISEDEDGTLQAFKTHLAEFIDPKFDEFNGRLFKTMGDGLLAEFASVIEAVQCAVAIQEGMARRNADEAQDKKIEFRIGINLGDVVVQDGDVFGDGVNVAARLEALADTGGICISRSARDQIRDRLDYGLEDWGEVAVKNIPRPVRVFRVLTDPEDAGKTTEKITGSRLGFKSLAAVILVVALVTAGAVVWWKPWASDVEAASLDQMAFPLPDIPSIAVLPFTNMSDDKDQEFFADGIAEDIITDIAKVSGIFVVARNSSFTYKGQPVKVRQISEELGVRYVLEGSVRRAGEKLRITAQLTDALKGAHLWAERYDRDVSDVFAVQSEITDHVVKALAVTLKAREHERLLQKHTTNIEAYDVFLKARRAVDKPIKKNILHGEELFKRVIELDPSFAGGYAGLSFNYSVQVRFQYGATPFEHLAQAFELANKAIELDPSYSWGYIALGGAHLANEDPDAAVEAVRKALALEPNGYEANLFIGFYLQFAGDAPLAVEHLNTSSRLSPVTTVRDLAFMQLAQFMNRNYAEVIRISEERVQKFPGGFNPTNAVFLAATFALLDKPEKAAAEVAELLEAYPGFNLSQWRYGKLWKREEDRSRLYEAAKKAGIPEFPNEH